MFKAMFEVIFRAKLRLKLIIRSLIITIGIVASTSVLAIEKPEYEVVAEIDGIEYRRYQSYVIAQTQIIGADDRSDAANEGFRRLFDYIAGDNAESQKIAMTAPLQQSEVQREDIRVDQVESLPNDIGWKISFMLPSDFTLASAPEPEDDRIQVRLVPEKTVAAIRYSGRWTDKNFDKFATRLLDSLSQADVEPIGLPESAVYNPPFVPLFLRRNEVLVEVASIPQ